jgi:hypothetical protein
VLYKLILTNMCRRYVGLGTLSLEAAADLAVSGGVKCKWTCER